MSNAPLFASMVNHFVQKGLNEDSAFAIAESMWNPVRDAPYSDATTMPQTDKNINIKEELF